MTKSKIVICGSIAMDRIMRFPAKYADVIDPNKLDVISVSVLVDSLTQAKGGVGANIAHNLAILGEEPLLMGSIGKDGQSYVAELAAMGVNTTNVHVSEDLATATFTVLNDTEDNQIGGFYPGAMSDAASLSFSQFASQDVLLCLSPHDPLAMQRQVEEAKANNLRLMYDPGQQINNPSPTAPQELKAGIEAAEILMANDYEFSALCNKTGLSHEQINQMVSLVIVTKGDKGSVLSGKLLDKPLEVGIVKPAKVVDPTGAGDSYRAGFLYGYLRQWELLKCARLGATTASFTVEAFGPQVKFTKEDVIKRYKQTFNEEVEL